MRWLAGSFDRHGEKRWRRFLEPDPIPGQMALMIIGDCNWPVKPLAIIDLSRGCETLGGPAIALVSILALTSADSTGAGNPCWYAPAFHWRHCAADCRAAGAAAYQAGRSAGRSTVVVGHWLRASPAMRDLASTG